MERFHSTGRRAVIGLGLTAFLLGAPRLALAAPPATPAAQQPPPVVPPRPATPLPEAANRQHLRYADREAESPRTADFRGGEGPRDRGARIEPYVAGVAVLLVAVTFLAVLL
jgi:hypothetical protein